MTSLDSLICRFNLLITNLLGRDKISKKFLKEVEHNNISLISSLLNEGLESHPFFPRNEAIYLAAQEGNSEIFKLLIPKKINKPSQQYYIEKVFYVAAQNGHTSIVNLLTKQIELNDDNFRLILFTASQNNHTATCKELINFYKNNLSHDILIPSLFNMVSNNNIELIKLVIQFIDIKKAYFKQPILFTDMSTDVMELLIKHGAQVDDKNKFNATAIMSHANKGNHKQVELLLKYGANVNHQDQDGHSALFLAVANNNIDTCKVLLSHGANCNLRTDSEFWHNGERAVDVAALSNNIDILELCLQYGAEIDYMGIYQNPPLLHIAVSNQSIEMVNILLRYGAQRDNIFLGRSALNIAEQSKNNDLIRILTSETNSTNAKIEKCTVKTEKIYSYLFSSRDASVPKLKKQITSVEQLCRYRT